MKNKLALISITLCGLAALVILAAPVPHANAGCVIDETPDHRNDPCYYTREHYEDDEDFAFWEEFCDDTVWELRSRKASAKAKCESDTRRAKRDIRRFCRRHCRWCEEDDNRRGGQGDGSCRGIPQRARTLARQGKYKASKCAWDAQRDYDAIYENARMSLEEAGYNCLLQKLYTEYRSVQRGTIAWERAAYARLDRATRDCRCVE